MGRVSVISAVAALAVFLTVSPIGEAGRAHAQDLRGSSAGASQDEQRGRPDFRRRPNRLGGPSVARYIAEGVAEFTLDRSTGRTMIIFDGGREVYVLYPQPAPRGDIIYKNDVGQPVLRITGLGGMIVFTDARPEGAPASLVGMGDPVDFQLTSSQRGLGARLELESRRIQQAAGRPIEIDAPDFGEFSSGPLVLEALRVTANAFEQLSASGAGRQALSKVDAVLVVEGNRPTARLEGGTLTLTVTPNWGAGGRPSSQLIAISVH